MRWVSLGLILCSSLPLSAQLPLGSGSVRGLAEAARQKWASPGLAVVVVQPEVEPLVLGLGSCEVGQNNPITPETLFPIASCTKAFTSSLLARLVDEGCLTWTDRVQSHFPEFKLSDPDVTRQLTVEDLLAHRCGLAGHDFLWYRAPWSIEESLKKVAFVPLEARFREQYHYSSLPVMAAGRVAERITGRSWPELIREKLAKPLELEPITFTSAESARMVNRASGHRKTRVGTIEPMPAYPLREANPAGSISLTPKSLANWLRFHLSDGRSPSGERVVSAKNLQHTRQAMIAMPKDAVIGPLYPESKEIHYGLGWVKFDYQGLTVYAHGGAIDGFRCQLTFVPEKQLGLALLNNLHESKLNIALTYALLDRALGRRDAPDWLDHFKKLEDSEAKQKTEWLAARNRQRVANSRPSLPLISYVGDYTHPAYGTSSITLKDGSLQWSWSSFSSPLEHYQFDVFRIQTGYFEDQLIEFGGQAGQVQRLAAVGQIFTRP